MFNISEEMENFKPIDLVSLEQKIGTIPEDMKNAIELYNKALEDIANHNEDMAIIALKKAITIYPAFYEAMNLMGVCYDSLDDAENARKMFNRVIQMENSSIRAMEYLDRLDGKTGQEDGKSRAQRNRNRNKNKPQVVSWLSSGLSPEKASPYFLKYILGFVMGVIAMAVLWLAFPAGKELIKITPRVNNTQQMKDLEADNAQLTQRLNEALTALETANGKEMQLRDQLDQYQKWNKTLRDLQTLAQEGQYKDVVVEIEKNLAGLQIPEDIEAEIIALNNECKPKAIQQLYTSAKKLYDGNLKRKSLDVFNQAASQYALAIQFMEQLEQKPTNAPEIYYNGGKAMAHSESPSKKEALDEARRYFESVKALAPNTQIASYAQARINEIDSGKAVRY